MKRYRAAGLLGLVVTALTFALSHLADGPVGICLMPGVLFAIVLIRHMLDWPDWLVALGNFLFYFLFTWLVTTRWAKWRAKSR